MNLLIFFSSSKPLYLPRLLRTLNLFLQETLYIFQYPLRDYNKKFHQKKTFHYI
jgi:hypothetical protein